MNPLSKRDWLLLLLLNKPLDRIRLMKALFLIWHRSGRTLENYYEFTPYMYGPCSFDLYAELDAAQQEHLVSQAPHSVAQWAAYYLTPKGASRAEAVQAITSKEIVNLIRAVAEKVIEEAIEVGAYGLGPPIEIWHVLQNSLEPLDEAKLAAVKDTTSQIRDREIQLLLGEPIGWNDESPARAGEEESREGST
jgi:hypothetical protein